MSWRFLSQRQLGQGLGEPRASRERGTPITTVPYVVVLMLFVLVVLGMAGQTKSTELADLSIEDLMQVEVVLAASRYEQETRTAPASVTIVTGEEIRARGYRSLADVLGSVRGFYTSYDRIYDYVGVRGFQRPGGYDTRVLLLLDGHRLNDPVFQSAAFGTDFPLDVALIDRIEVVRGPSSSVYGTSAVLGVVNVVTVSGSGLSGVEVSGAYGSLGTRQGRISYGDRLGSNVELLVSGTLYASEGEELYFEELDDPAIGTGFIDNDDGWCRSAFAKATLGGWTLEAAYSMREKGIPTGAWDIVADDTRNRVWDGRVFADLRWERGSEAGVRTSVGLSYDRCASYGDYVWDYAEDGEPAWIVVNKDEAVGESYSGDARLVAVVGGGHTLSAGAEYRGNTRQDQTNYDTEVYLDSRRSGSEWGLYAQDEFAIGEGLVATAGLRHDHYETFGGTTNPRVGLVVMPSSRTTIKLLYGTAFRAPSPYEMYYHDGWGTQKPSPDLEPELMSALEFVAEQDLGGGWSAALAGFTYTLDELITLVTDPTDSLLVYRNTEHVQSRGAEFELEKRSTSGWRGRASLALQRARDADSGARLTNAPTQLAKLGVTAPLLGGRIETGLRVRYVASRLTPAGSEVDPYAVCDVNVRVPRLIGDWEASLGIYNVFDVRYKDPASEELPQEFLEQDGRTVRLVVTARF